MKVFNRAVKLAGEKRVISSTTVQVLEYDKSGKILRATGTTVPTGAGYAKGCIFIKTDAATGLTGIYQNIGTTSAASFATGVASSVSGVVATFAPTAVQQALTGAGAVNLTTYYTAVTNTGADALTLADSTVIGQLKKVKMVADPGTDSTLTFNTNATVVFADVGDYVVLMWNGSDWLPVELGNDADGTTAPAYTAAS
jgi:hypothetical protein